MPKLINPAATRQQANARRELNQRRAEAAKPPSIREFIPPTPRSIGNPLPRDPTIPASRSYTRPGRGRMKQAPAPTPWMTIGTPTTQTPYRCRLLVKRRGGALHLEFDVRDNPPDVQGRSVYMFSRRLGYYQFMQAGHALLRASMWDARCAPGERAVWNTHAAEYGQRSEHAMTIALFIDRLLYPRPGRPSRDVTAAERHAVASSPNAGLRTGYQTARARRRNEILTATQRITNTLIPLVENVDDARRMVGYTWEERKRLTQLYAAVRVATDELRDAVFNDKLADGTAAPTPTRSMATMQEATREEMMHDLDPLEIERIMDGTPVNAAEIETAGRHGLLGT